MTKIMKHLMMLSAICMCSVLLCAAPTFADDTAGDGTPQLAESQESETETEAEPAAKNGLLQENGVYRYYENGTMVKKAWRTVTNAKGISHKYYFNAKGKAVSGFQKIGSAYYVFNVKTCQLLQPAAKKVYTINGKKYLVSPKGKAMQGWDSSKTYYFGSKYVPVTGLVAIKDKIYCFKSSGKLNAAKTKKLLAACKCEKSNMNTLYKLIGKPLKAKYYTGGCYGPGNDGVLKYKNFDVYTYKEGSKEIYMGASQH